MGEVVCADRAALSQAGQRTTAERAGTDAADLFSAALQQWFNLADPAVEEALYDSATLRQFAGIDLGAEPVPDETTVCKFRHLLEENHLGEEILGTVNQHLQAKGVRITTGTIVDATLIHAPSSTKNREQSRDPEMHQVKKGKNWYFGMKAHVGWTARARSSPRRWRRPPMFPMWRCCRTCCAEKRRVGRRSVSGADGGDPGVCPASARFYAAALSLQGPDRG